MSHYSFKTNKLFLLILVLMLHLFSMEGITDEKLEKPKRPQMWSSGAYTSSFEVAFRYFILKGCYHAEQNNRQKVQCKQMAYGPIDAGIMQMKDQAYSGFVMDFFKDVGIQLLGAISKAFELHPGGKALSEACDLQQNAVLPSDNVKNQ